MKNEDLMQEIKKQRKMLFAVIAMQTFIIGFVVGMLVSMAV